MGLPTKSRSAIRGSRFRLLAAMAVLIAWSTAEAAPVEKIVVKQQTNFGPEDAKIFLQRYGYLNDSGFNANSISEESFKGALTTYQSFSGLPITGTLDAATTEKMQIPRCGVKDINPEEHAGRRQKRYTHIGFKWWNPHLTYRLRNKPPTSSKLSKWDVMAALERATAVWSAVSGLSFSRASRGQRNANVSLSFERGLHHLFCSTFDGPGGVAAHAQAPSVFGKAIIHFDADENWTNDNTGFNLFQVAVHELGHVLGLDHSDVPDAVMAPAYSYKPAFKLHSDDIAGIQALYGNGSPDEQNPLLMWLVGILFGNEQR